MSGANGGASSVHEQDFVDGAVLDTIHRALDPRVIEDAIEAAVDMLIANRTNHSTDRIAIEREIAESRSAQRRLLDAIKRSNQSLDTLVQELQTEGNQDAVAPAASRHAGQL